MVLMGSTCSALHPDVVPNFGAPQYRDGGVPAEGGLGTAHKQAIGRGDDVGTGRARGGAGGSGKAPGRGTDRARPLRLPLETSGSAADFVYVPRPDACSFCLVCRVGVGVCARVRARVRA